MFFSENTNFPSYMRNMFWVTIYYTYHAKYRAVNTARTIMDILITGFSLTIARLWCEKVPPEILSLDDLRRSLQMPRKALLTVKSKVTYNERTKENFNFKLWIENLEEHTFKLWGNHAHWFQLIQIKWKHIEHFCQDI